MFYDKFKLGFFKERKGISPVVATVLLIIVAVGAVVGFNTWFKEYQSSTLTDIEIQANDVMQGTKIEIIVGSSLYIKSDLEENVSINNIKIGGENCSITHTLTNGMNVINVSSCLENVSEGTNEVAIYTNNNILSKNLYLTSKTTSLGSLGEEGSNCYSLTNGLVGLWHFNNDFTDSSGSENNGDDDGTGVSFNSSGKLSSAAYFNGSNQHINISNIDISSGGTILGWMNPKSSGSDKLLIGADGSGEQEFQIWIEASGGDHLEVVLYDGGSWPNVIGDYTSTSNWYHVAMTYNGSMLKFYTDGDYKGNTTGTIVDSTDDLWIGELQNGLKDMDGLIDELAIYNRELNSTEISNIYTQNNGGTPICGS